MNYKETLKAWCHWKKKDCSISNDDKEFVNAIDALLKENEELKAKIAEPTKGEE